MHSNAYQWRRIRKLLRNSNYLLTLIDAYRNDELSENEKEHLWIGIQDTALRLASRHYKTRQTLPRRFWYEPRPDSEAEEKQAIRVQYIYEFIRDYKAGTPATGILYALHRRFQYLEKLVECKLIGLDLLADLPMPTRTNTNHVRYLILGDQLNRRLTREFKRVPTQMELITEYAVERIKNGKLVALDDLKRFAHRYFPYQTIKQSYYSNQYTE